MKTFELLLLAAVMALVLTGCQTTAESDNVSERPWNSQKGWEHGLPTGINQGR
jgi:hypothetical protein